MRILEDGSQVVIRRTQGGFAVEHIAVAGTIADTIVCDTFQEARAAFAYGPSRW